MEHNFRKLSIWILAMDVVKDVYMHIEDFPIDERYGLRSQVSRSAVSIPSNIAEGCGRSSRKDFGHFLDIALGSCYELETQLIIVNQLFLIQTETTIEKCQNLQRMIAGFKKKINNN